MVSVFTKHPLRLVRTISDRKNQVRSFVKHQYWCL